jgi:hypothetical protein
MPCLFTILLLQLTTRISHTPISILLLHQVSTSCLLAPVSLHTLVLVPNTGTLPHSSSPSSGPPELLFRCCCLLGRPRHAAARVLPRSLSQRQTYSPLPVFVFLSRHACLLHLHVILIVLDQVREHPAGCSTCFLPYA